MPVIVFSDDFESGSLASWDASTASGPGQSIAASGAAAHTGTYGALATHQETGADQNYEAKISKSIPDTPNQRLYVHAWIRMTNVVSIGYGVNGSKSPLAIKAADGQSLLWLSIRSGGYRLSYMAKSGSVISLNPNVVVPTGSWRRFRLSIDRSGTYPLLQGWVSTDGVSWTLLGESIDQSVGTAGVAKQPSLLETGVVHIANFEQGRYQVQVDEVEARHSLGNATEWTTLFDVRIPLAASILGRSESSGAFAWEQAVQSDVAYGYSRVGNFVYEQPISAEVVGQADRRGVLDGHQEVAWSLSTLIDRIARFFWDQPITPAISGARSGVQGSGAYSIASRSRIESVQGEIQPVKTVEASVQTWGAALVSDEARGLVTPTNEAYGAVIVSDEKG